MTSSQPFYRLLAALLLAGLLSAGGCGGSSSGSDTTTPDPDPPVNDDETGEDPDDEPEPQPEPDPEPEPEDRLPTLEPDTAPDPALPERGSPEWAEAREAARFLMQTSFGPTAKSLDHVMEVGQEAWLEEQFDTPTTPHLALLDRRVESLGWEAIPAEEDDDQGWLRDLQRSDVWWEIALRGEDQLRQRVAFALSQIFVISNVSDVLYNDTRGIASYHDMLANNAFGNFRQLLRDVTLHPMMGEYLSHVRNRKADEEENIRPDENYAREVMQLFSIGLVELELDGTIKTDDNGDPVPTYDQETIKAFARVFTGWNFATANDWWEWTTDAEGEALPMKAFQYPHDQQAKTLLNGRTLSGGQSAEQDMSQALDNLFNHPNVGPFIGKQLIKRLVTSNPSPDYVEDVARVFNENDEGKRGDMEAVIRAILTHPEARQDPTEHSGKLREPILQFAHVWRAFKAPGVMVRDGQGNDTGERIRFRGSMRVAGQRPYGSFSVFNFYQPGYAQPGPIARAGMKSPEFQIHTESTMVSKINHLIDSVAPWRDMDLDHEDRPVAEEGWDIYLPLLNLREEKALANQPRTLVDRLDLLLTGGQMDAESRQALQEHIDSLPAANGDWNQSVRVSEAASLIVASPYFAVQH